MNETRAPKSPSAPAPDDPGWEGRPNGLRFDRRALYGYSLSLLGGVLQTAQYALVTYAKKYHPVPGDTSGQAFDPLGSWTASFGVGAVAVTSLVYGVLYSTGLVFSTLAVSSAGAGIVMAQKSAFALVCAGAWGILWFREIQGLACVAWCGGALLTMASVVLLGFEK